MQHQAGLVDHQTFSNQSAETMGNFWAVDIEEQHEMEMKPQGNTVSDPYRNTSKLSTWIVIGESHVKISKIDAIFVRIKKHVQIVKVLVGDKWLYAVNNEFGPKRSAESIQLKKKEAQAEAERIIEIVEGLCQN